MRYYIRTGSSSGWAGNWAFQFPDNAHLVALVQEVERTRAFRGVEACIRRAPRNQRTGQ